MINRLMVGLVMVCWRRWAMVVLLAVVATIGLAWWAGGNLGLDTDESKLLAADLPFRKAEDEMARAFPGEGSLLVVVIDAPTPGQAEDAADRLAALLETHKDVFEAAHRPSGTAFFKREGLLYLSVDELQALSDRLTKAQPMLGTLARDPSLRGVLTALNLMLDGAAHGEVAAGDLEPALKRFADASASVLAGDAHPLDWTELMGSASPMAHPRSLVLAAPKLDFSELTPGARGSAAIRADAAALGLDAAHGYRVRLTGSVALTDDNFATVAEGVEISTPLSVIAVMLILLAAVRSPRLVAIIFATLATGLAATAAFASVTVGTLNPISVAFAVMFVGIAVDFAIQFVIRYRDARAHHPDDDSAMAACARTIIAPLSLAAASTAVGFLSFLPTSYAGVSQLGLVAGGGMLIALAVDLTFLPALLRLSRPPGERDTMGLPFAKSLDGFLARHPRKIVAAAAALAALGVALLPSLKFDSDPLNLQNPKAEAVSTFRDLAASSDTSPYSIQILTNSLDEAGRLADRLETLSEVTHAVTLTSLVPEHQDEKLAILSDLWDLYAVVMDPNARLPAPTLADNEAAMIHTAAKLRAMTNDPSANGKLLADHLDQIRAAGPAKIEELGTTLLGGLPQNIAILSGLFQAKPITIDSLPTDVTDEWRAIDGRIKVSVWPKHDMHDQKELRHFVQAVLNVAPTGSGMPVSIVEAGKAIMGSFIQAGITAIIAIAMLLGLMLRRLLDAVLVVVPLILGGLYTVIGCVAFGLDINFANIIALPLLLGIGVAFNIYFVVNWRNGVRDHLQTSTSRAVLFSAMTTTSAFGSLAVSPHVGTASMGLLLFLSVTLSVATTFLVLPAIFHLLPRKEAPCPPQPAD
jgi:uncharacterized protein